MTTPRMRTAEGALAIIKEDDPDSAVTLRFIRRLTAGRIIAAALVCSGAGQDGTDIVAGYTHMDFKRAIEGLMAAKKQPPSYAEYYEGGIKHILRFWLHGGAPGQGAAS